MRYVSLSGFLFLLMVDLRVKATDRKESLGQVYEAIGKTGKHVGCVRLASACGVCEVKERDVSDAACVCVFAQDT
ncbi:MAG TPA: hypothetical protein VJK72_00545 [Candidatus Nanoarchaeia archaeon]|nr:hypothetical protein [Candidatus Nanoarchaeia archaeon]